MILEFKLSRQLLLEKELMNESENEEDLHKHEETSNLRERDYQRLRLPRPVNHEVIEPHGVINATLRRGWLEPIATHFNAIMIYVEPL